ncbi:hypothetical protein BV898_01801 [Hypsibius exemplaris]|uniref:Secreted protein n=1 Tax=Hypsibius exemplaris TaxID=2072580 RepID=A0A1W0XAG3_HYPEX|nr:hypothetical protein BV898_01801 [Hypsibius exemplaris]
MMGFYLVPGLYILFGRLSLLDFSSASGVCSTQDNPCMAAMESSTDWNFLYGLNKEQLARACDIYLKSIHCLDYSLASCTAPERESVKTHYLHLRISMDRICYDIPTHTSYLVYSGCLKKAYSRTEVCMNRFTNLLENATRHIGLVTQQQQKEQRDPEVADIDEPNKLAEARSREANPNHLYYICNGLRHLIVCIHNAVTCSETSFRDIKDVLTLMIRGGVPSHMYQECTRVSGGGTTIRHHRTQSSSSSAAAAAAAGQFAYLPGIGCLRLFILAIVSVVFHAAVAAAVRN